VQRDQGACKYGGACRFSHDLQSAVVVQVDAASAGPPPRLADPATGPAGAGRSLVGSGAAQRAEVKAAVSTAPLASSADAKAPQVAQQTASYGMYNIHRIATLLATA